MFVLGRARKANFRAPANRLDEPAKLSLGMVASLQSPLPFHLAKLLYLAWRTPPAAGVFAPASGLLGFTSGNEE
jgi:hypothetical protein